jgi:hypothetical protein
MSWADGYLCSSSRLMLEVAIEAGDMVLQVLDKMA